MGVGGEVGRGGAGGVRGDTRKKPGIVKKGKKKNPQGQKGGMC